MHSGRASHTLESAPPCSTDRNMSAMLVQSAFGTGRCVQDIRKQDMQGQGGEGGVGVGPGPGRGGVLGGIRG